MVEHVFRSIDDVLRKEAGCSTELDYAEQTSWLLFLKYLDARERERREEAEREGVPFRPLLDEPYRWETWAAPTDEAGRRDPRRARTGAELVAFVDGALFPYLRGFQSRATGPRTLEAAVGGIFAELENKLASGENLRAVIELVDTLRFGSDADKHELGHLYEAKLRNVGNAGRNGGEYYTPRPLIRAIVAVVDPKVGETVYDGACGSGGFLCEAFVHMRRTPGLEPEALRRLRENTFYGKEKKSLAYVLATMNLLLHGLDAPSLAHTNTLAEATVAPVDAARFDVVLANPPFGGREDPAIQRHFPIRTAETAYLFLQHFLASLKDGGRAAVVIKHTFLSNDDAAARALRRVLLDTCELHTILDCPGGVFPGTPTRTVVLFFRKGAPTRSTWFYQLEPGRSLGRTEPLTEADLAEFVALQPTAAESPRSWRVDRAALDEATCALTVRNPHRAARGAPPRPTALVATLRELREEAGRQLAAVRWELEGAGPLREASLGELCRLRIGRTPPRHEPRCWDPTKTSGHVWLSIADLLRCEGGLATESKEQLSDVGAALCPVVPAGTLLVSFKLTLGRVAIAGRPLRTNEAIAALTELREDVVGRDYLLHYLQFFDWEGAAEGEDKLKGKTLSKAKLERLRVRFPPRAAQDRLVARLAESLDGVARLAELVRQELAATDALRRALFHEAFASEAERPVAPLDDEG